MKWLKDNKWIPLLVLVVSIIGALFKILYAEQNKKIDSKADEKEVVQMMQKFEAIRVITAKQYDEEKLTQKEKDTAQNLKDEQMRETLEQLNIQMILLTKELKKE